MQQDFSRIRHLVATQNKACGYLPPWRAEPAPPCGVATEIVQLRTSISVPKQVAYRSCPYNKFLHDLLGRVANHSWIMIVDDDALLLSPHHVTNVMRYASRVPTNTVLLQPSLVGDNTSGVAPRGFDGKTIWPLRSWGDRSNAFLRVDMSNLVFHQSMVEHIHLSNACGADKAIFKQLLAGGGKPRVLTEEEVAGVGIWANSHGATRGGVDVGRRWRNIGTQRPQGGRLVRNVGLAALLAKGQTEFTRDQMATFYFAAVRPDSFIQVGNHYYQPALQGASPPPPAEKGCTVRRTVIHKRTVVFENENETNETRKPTSSAGES